MVNLQIPVHLFHKSNLLILFRAQLLSNSSVDMVCFFFVLIGTLCSYFARTLDTGLWAKMLLYYTKLKSSLSWFNSFLSHLNILASVRALFPQKMFNKAKMAKFSGHVYLQCNICQMCWCGQDRLWGHGLSAKQVACPLYLKYCRNGTVQGKPISSMFWDNSVLNIFLIYSCRIWTPVASI